MSAPALTTPQPSHKDANRKYLRLVAGFNILLLMGLAGQLMPVVDWLTPYFMEADASISTGIKKGLIVPTLTFVTNTLLEMIILAFTNSIHRKHKYAALKTLTPFKKYPNFGHQAFSKYVHDDSRIDVALLQEHYQDRWSMEPEDQDKLYLEIQQDLGDASTAVAGRHREKLLARDSFTIALLTTVISSTAVVVLIDVAWDWDYRFLGAILLELIACVFWANKAWRRHGNEVLAAETNRIRKLNKQGGDQSDDSI